MLENLQTLEGHTGRVWTLAWNKEGTMLASSGSDKTIRLWARGKHDNWECATILTDTHSKSIRRICWSSCGQYLASASFDATVCIWKRDTNDGTWSTVVNLDGHENEVKSVAWSHDGNYLASCGRDRTVWIWEKGTPDPDSDMEIDSSTEWDCSDVKNDHSKDVKQIVWHPEHNILVSCSYDDTIKFFHKDGDDWKCYQTLSAHQSTVWSATFSKSGEYLATSSDDKTVRIWKNHAHDKLPNVEPHSWKCISVIQGYHRRSVYDVSWCPNNDVIASVSGDNSIALYRSSSFDSSSEETFTCIDKINQAHDCDVNSVEWNPKIVGLLATGSDDRTIKLWNYNPEEKGMKELKVVDEILHKLSCTTLAVDQTDDSIQTRSMNVTDFSTLLNSIATLQELQNESHEDGDKYCLEKLFDLKLAQNNNTTQLLISNLALQEGDNLVREFCVDIIGRGSKVDYRFKFVIDSKFRLNFPRRSIKLMSVAGELFLMEKTGDLYKILPSGETLFLLGHLFTFSDVKFITNPTDNRVVYIISADRDEKIRISNYPNTYDIERFCFGHKHLVRALRVLDNGQFVSIDQKDNVCLWDLNSLKSLSSEVMKPVKTLVLNDRDTKRFCKRSEDNIASEPSQALNAYS